MPSRPELPPTIARYIAAWIAGLSTHAFNRGYISTGLVKCDERGRVYTRSLAEAFETLGQPPLTPEAYWIAYGARASRRAYQRTYRKNHTTTEPEARVVPLTEQRTRLNGRPMAF